MLFCSCPINILLVRKFTYVAGIDLRATEDGEFARNGFRRSQNILSEQTVMRIVGF